MWGACVKRRTIRNSKKLYNKVRGDVSVSLSRRPRRKYMRDSPLCACGAAWSVCFAMGVNRLLSSGIPHVGVRKLSRPWSVQPKKHNIVRGLGTSRLTRFGVLLQKAGPASGRACLMCGVKCRFIGKNAVNYQRCVKVDASVATGVRQPLPSHHRIPLAMPPRLC